MPRRITTIAALLTAGTALATSASAQTSTFARSASATEQLIATADAPVSLPMAAPQAASSSIGNDLIAESMPSTHWGVIPLHESETDADEAEDNSNSGFFGSTMGRASMAGIAGLAGAGYLAMRDGNATSAPVSYTVGTTATLGGTVASLPDAPVIVETPEPASIALLAIGLGGLGLVARRRRTS